MSRAPSSETPGAGAVPLQKADDPPRDEGWRIASASEETVPVRVAAERVKADEQAERLRLVTGRRRSLLPRRQARR